MLALRAHSAHELRLKLRLRNVDTALAEAVIARLQTEGWLDENQFAQAFVRHRVQQGYGPVKVAAELRQRGVTPALITAALATGDWELALRRALRKRVVARTRAALAQASRFLYQRGFEGSRVRAILTQWTEHDERGDE